MEKKLLALALTAAMTLSLAAPAFAADLPEGWIPADGARAAGDMIKPIEGENSTYIPTAQEAQAYVMEKGWMTGTKVGFEPELPVNRATMYEMFWKMEGKPEVNNKMATFPDAQGRWFETSARWAEQEGLTTGTGSGYEGERVITKAEVMAILYRYMKEYKALDVSVEEGWTLEVFEDAGKVQDWATEAMTWGWLSGVACQEDSDSTIDPEAQVTRAELSQMLTVMGGIMAEQTRRYVEETVSIQGDGRTIPAIVTLPVGEGKFPAVVINHGHGGDKSEGGGFTGVARALAEAGVASIRMDFPGCGDSSASFQDNTMTNMVSDSNASLAYLLENYNVDADRLGILGYSMGGRIASEIVGAAKNPYKAVVLLSAANVSMKEMAVNLFGSMDNYNALKSTAQKDGFAVFTTVYGQVQELSKAWFEDMEKGKPMESLAKFKGPVLVLHGDVDEMITDEMNKAILKAYPSAQELIVPEADHGYGFYSDQPKVTALVEGAICGFFQMNLNGRLGPARVGSLDDWGDVYTDMPGTYFAGAGFDRGDILKVTVGDKVAQIPFCTTYSNVDNGKPLLLTDGDGMVTLSYNMDNFTEQFGVEADTLTYFEMAEKEGYLEEYSIRNINSLRTNNREDYTSDEVFANFRAVTMGSMGKGVLYRSSSPVDPKYGRNTYSDELIEKAGVKTVIDLADTEETYAAHEGVNDSYAITTNTVKLGISGDVSSEENAAKLKDGLEYMLDNEGPYMIHCTEGKDRAGFVVMVLECLMGGKLDEVVDDHMVSYENYFFVEKDSDRWNRLAEGTVYADLLKMTGAKDAKALARVDLVKAAESYLTGTVGLSGEQVAALKGVLAGK